VKTIEDALEYADTFDRPVDKHMSIVMLAAEVRRLRGEVAILTEQRNDHINGSAESTTQCIEYQHLMAELREENERLKADAERIEWQPIEKAPKDGTSILGFAGGMFAVVHWYGNGNYWDLDVCGSYAEDGEWTPTHWMPLPEPPK